jgi:hypothetical protein
MGGRVGGLLLRQKHTPVAILINLALVLLEILTLATADLAKHVFVAASTYHCIGKCAGR